MISWLPYAIALLVVAAVDPYALVERLVSIDGKSRTMDDI